MTVRRLSTEEWPRLQQRFVEAFNTTAPHPTTCVVVVAEEAGEIVGFVTAQAVLHVDPAWVHPAHRTCAQPFDSVWLQLMRGASEILPQALPNAQMCLCHAEEPRLVPLLKRIGFAVLPGTLMRWMRGVA